MLRTYGHIPFALLLSLSLFISCRNEEVTNPSDHSVDLTGMVVMQTDSDEWRVIVFQNGILASEPFSVDSPYHVPTHQEATILRTITYGAAGQRYMTDDGYTFGMPSASVSKAGTKTRYGVLGLWRRKTIIEVHF